MVNMRIYDGTSGPKSGKLLAYALEDIGPVYGKEGITVSPPPGSKDIEGWRLINEIAKLAFDAKRKKVDYQTFLNFLNRRLENFEAPNSKRLIITEEDLYGDGVDWCFGGCDGENKSILISTKRLTNENLEEGTYVHELGHMFGAAPKGRTNTIEYLGPHCTNDDCIMQPIRNKSDAVINTNYLADRIRNREQNSWFCDQCKDDIRKTKLG